MINMIKIRFSYCKAHVILRPEKNDERGRIMKSNHQVMACGACAFVVDESGEMTTSIDHFIKSVKRLFVRSESVKSAESTTAPARL